MYNPIMGQKNYIFLGFEAILEMCYEIWSKFKLGAAPSIFQSEFWRNFKRKEFTKICPLNAQSRI